MVSGAFTDYSHQAVFPHYPQVSSFASLCCAHILQFLFLLHFFTIYLFLLVETGSLSFWGVSGVVSGCYASLMYYGTRHGSLEPLWHLTAGCFRLALCPGHMS